MADIKFTCKNCELLLIDLVTIFHKMCNLAPLQREMLYHVTLYERQLTSGAKLY